jgi:hypothetical protein
MGENRGQVLLDISLDIVNSLVLYCIAVNLLVCHYTRKQSLLLISRNL